MGEPLVRTAGHLPGMKSSWQGFLPLVTEMFYPDKPAADIVLGEMTVSALRY